MRSSVAGVVQRKAQVEDVSLFNALLNASGGPALFRATFGQYNYHMMIENSCESLISVTEDGQDKCLGFLVVNDSPTVAVDNDTFLGMVASIRPYLPEVRASNVLFLNFFLVDETSRFDSDMISSDLVRNAFTISPKTDWIVWLCPSKVKLGFWMEDNFVSVPLSSTSEGEGEEKMGDKKDKEGVGLLLSSGVRLLYLQRSAFMPRLLVRGARVEDNDDLLPILHSSNPQIVAGQSDFFLADLIQAQDERNRFLVGVHNNNPVGMLATSLDVNVTLITKIFDLERYPDIIVAKQKRPPPPPLVVLGLGDIRAIKSSLMRDLVTSSSMNSLFIDAEALLGGLPALAPGGEEKRDEQEEARAAQAAMDTLKEHIARAVGAAKQPPTACYITGFPRTDTEAHQLSLGYMHVDIVAELCDESDGDGPDPATAGGGGGGGGDEGEAMAGGEAAAGTPAEGGQEDAFYRAHVESVEVLRNFLGSSSTLPGQEEVTPAWLRINLGADGGTVEKDFFAAIKDIVDGRAQEVKAMLEAEEEEPPLANAFAVTVFCVDGKFDTRGDDLLRVAFEDNPTLDYCLYMVSNAAAPTLLTASMALVKQRPGVSFDQALFIMRREALLASDDLLHIERLLEDHLPAAEAFLAPLQADEKDRMVKVCLEGIKQTDIELKHNPPEVCFAVMMGPDIVGIVSASRKHLSNDDLTWIRANYQVDDVINYDRHRLRAQAQITNFVVSPVYSRSWTRYILREIMRKYAKTLLYFQGAPGDAPAAEIIEEFIPIAPRRRMQPAPGHTLSVTEKPSQNSASVNSPLFYLSKRQILESKICVLKRVVVVGGGSSSYALLEKLLFVPHLSLPNLQVVLELPPVALKTRTASPDLAFSTKCSGVLSLDDADDPTMQELSAMGVAHRVTVIRGRLTDIDRENRAIVISDEVISEYDVLVIAAATKDCSTKKFPATSGVHPAHCALRGMFGLGDVVSDSAALVWVQRQSKDRQEVVVFGEGIDLLGAVGALIQQGVEPYRITAVVPSEKMPEICHPFIMESALRNLKVSGVNVKIGYDLADVQLTKFGGVESVLLKKMHVAVEPDADPDAPVEPETLTLPCFSLLCANTKHCDSDVFTAINDCGIVFDGGVVVDQNFCTVDPNIYAVGSFSRFSRLFRDQPLHSKHSSREMGLFVASRLLERNLDFLSPQVVFGETSSKRARGPALTLLDAKSLPTFRFPKTLSVALPNSRFFCSSQLSSAAGAADTALLVTGDLTSDRIGALRVDSLGMVMELAYVGKAEVEAKNLGKLVGWHESYLNGAVYSYEQGLVDDWIEYFRGEWATALFHDTFTELSDTLLANLAMDKNAFSIVDLMLDAGDRSIEDTEVLAERRRVLGPRAEKLPVGTYKMIEQNTLEFLRKNKAMLNRFWVPPSKAQKK